MNAEAQVRETFARARADARTPVILYQWTQAALAGTFNDIPPWCRLHVVAAAKNGQQIPHHIYQTVWTEIYETDIKESIQKRNAAIEREKAEWDAKSPAMKFWLNNWGWFVVLGIVLFVVAKCTR